MEEVASVFVTPRSSSSTHSSTSPRPAEPRTPPWSKPKQVGLFRGGGGERTGDSLQDSSEFEDDLVSPLPLTTTSKKTVQQPKTLPSSVKVATKSSNSDSSNKSDYLGDDNASTQHGSFASFLTTPRKLGAPTVSAMAITSLLMNSPGDNSCRSLLNAASLSSLQAAAPPQELMTPFLGGGGGGEGRREMLLSPLPRHARSVSPKFTTTTAATITTTTSSKLMAAATAATTTTNETRDETDTPAQVHNISSGTQPSGEPSSSAVTSLEATCPVTPSMPPPPPPPSIITQDDESLIILLADPLSNAPPSMPPTGLELTPTSNFKLEKLRAKRRELEEKHEKLVPNRLQASPTNEDAADKPQQLHSPTLSINHKKPPLQQRPRQSPPQRATPRIKKKKKRQGGGGGSLHSSLSSFNESLSDLLSFNAGVEINIEIEDNVNGDDMFMAPLNEDISLSTKHWNDDDEDEDEDEEYDNKSGDVSLEPFGGEALENMGTEYAGLLQQYQDLKEEFKDREEELMQTLSNLVAATSSQEFRRLLNSYQALQYHYLELINDIRLAEKNHRKVQDDFRDFQAAAHQREEALMQQLQQKEEKYLKLQEQYDSLQREMEEKEEQNIQQLLQLEQTVLQVSKLVDTQVTRQGSVRSALQVKLKRTLGRTGSKKNDRSNSKLVRENFFSDSTFDRVGNVRISSTGSFNPNNKRQGSSSSFNCNHQGHGTTSSSNGSNSSFNHYHNNHNGHGSGVHQDDDHTVAQSNVGKSAPTDGAAFPARWSFTRSSSEKAVQTKSDEIKKKKKKDRLAQSAHIPRR
jgi:hypothetical protein